jgi:4-amino-4-deoxy-L-arabinose transferase-like glycosyltransferase
MAIPHAIAGIDGATAVVILSTFVAVIATGLLASQLGGSIAAVIASMLIAFTPVFLHQSIQPMSDVPVTAAWMMCFLLLARRGASFDALAGIACAIAVLIRPNLAPLALVPLFLARRKRAFSLPVAIAGLFLAIVQWFWYGSVFRSGYGTAEELFAISNVAPNASRYFTWLGATAPVLFLSVFGFIRLRRDRTTQALFAFVALVIGSYLVYAVFDDWSYLRFLLPSMAVLAMCAAVALAAWIDRWPMAWRAPLLFVLLLGVTAYSLFIARSHDTFKLADQLRRVSRVGDFVNSNVPDSAVILSGEQSGSMRYYTHRSILRWEAATSGTLTSAITTLEQNGRPVYVVLDAWENEPFRKKFATVPVVSLDWPPVLEAGTSHRTRLWKLSDRDRFLRGEPLNIIRLP